MSYSDLYTELETIGSGNHGNKNKGHCLIVQEIETGSLFAAKKISTKDLSSADQVRSKQEADLLKSLKHPNIVSYKASFTEPNFFVIIMEYCQQGDLGRLIRRASDSKTLFSEQQVLSWFYQLANALEFIHSKNILHRDIKSSNIFLTREGILKLGDFGISKILSGTLDVARTMVGTPLYMSPELCQQDAYASKSDIWALGCVFYEICCLKPPFFSSNLLSLISKITKETPEDIPAVFVRGIQDLIMDMLAKDPDLRISSKEIIKSEVFQDFLINPMVSVDVPLSNLLDTSINPLEICNANETGVLNLPTPDYPVSVSDIEGSIDEAEIPQDERNNLIDDDDENVVIHTTHTMNTDSWANVIRKDAAEVLNDKKLFAIRALGMEKFQEIYERLNELRSIGTEEDLVNFRQVFTELMEKFPNSDLRVFFVVDQILYYETNNS